MRLFPRLRVDMSNVLLLVAIILGIICLCIPPSARGAGFPDAAENYSSYEVRVAPGFCPGATPIFVDEIADAPNIFGRYIGYAVVFEQNKPPRIIENVFIIAVKGIAGSRTPVSVVMHHECVHYQQRLRYDTYFDFLGAYQKAPRLFEQEAYTRGAMMDAFTVASIGKPKDPRPAALVFQ